MRSYPFACDCVTLGVYNALGRQLWGTATSTAQIQALRCRGVQQLRMEINTPELRAEFFNLVQERLDDYSER